MTGVHINDCACKEVCFNLHTIRINKASLLIKAIQINHEDT